MRELYTKEQEIGLDAGLKLLSGYAQNANNKMNDQNCKQEEKLEYISLEISKLKALVNAYKCFLKLPSKSIEQKQP